MISCSQTPAEDSDSSKSSSRSTVMLGNNLGLHLVCERFFPSLLLLLWCAELILLSKLRPFIEWHVTRSWGPSGKINDQIKKRLTDPRPPVLYAPRLQPGYGNTKSETLPPPVKTNTHTHLVKSPRPSQLWSLHLGTKGRAKPVSFSQLGAETRSGDEERQQQLLESAWKLLICELPAGLIQPLHECVCFHTGLLNSFISCHQTSSGVDK